jgi:UPF0716 protein FxsA
MPLFLLFVVAPLVELFVIVRTGQWIGYLNTLGLIILGGFIGSAVLKRGGMKMWGRFVEQVQTGHEPSKEIADGVCILLAGALFIAPGFISDAVAILLLFPPTRALFRRWLIRRKDLASFGRGRVIRATYGGPRSTNITDVTDVTDVNSRETRGELDP